MRAPLSSIRLLASLVAVLTLVASGQARAAEDAAAEAARLYDVEMTATPQLAQGAAGELVVRIKPKPGAEIHKQAPISLSLDATGVKPGQEKLGRAELTMEGENASFTVPFTAVEPGAASIDADLTFFVCTDKVCARQQRKATLPVTVNG